VKDVRARRSTRRSLALATLLMALLPALGWAERGGYGPGIVEIARVHNLEPALIAAIISVESNFNPRAVSRKGARGLMQLMPATARDLGVGDIHDPWENIEGGARFMREKLDRFGGDIRLALAAYNAGEAAVTRHGGIPPYPETIGFVNEVLARFEALKTRGLPSVGGSAGSTDTAVSVRDATPPGAEVRAGAESRPGAPEARRAANIRPAAVKSSASAEPAIVLEVEDAGPPARAMAQLREGARLVREGHLGKAIEHYRSAQALAPRSPEPHNHLGLVYLKAGRLDEAQSEFEAALRLAPDTGSFLNNLGLVLHMKGEFRAALRVFRRAWEGDRSRIESGVNLALVLRRLGRRDEARAILGAVLRVHGGLPEGHLNFASLSEEDGDHEAAIFHYRRFLELTAGQSGSLRDEVQGRVAALQRP
jgi:Flp pilus assembly protein TadD